MTKGNAGYFYDLDEFKKAICPCRKCMYYKPDSHTCIKPPVITCDEALIMTAQVESMDNPRKRRKTYY